MRCITVPLVVLTLFNAGMAKGKPRTIMPALSKAKNFIAEGMPAKLQKTITGTAAMGLLLWGQLPAVADYPPAQQAAAVLSPHKIDKELNQLKLDLKREHLQESMQQSLEEMRELLVELEETKPYEPEFESIVSEAREELAMLARIVSIFSSQDTLPSSQDVLSHDELEEFESQFKFLAEGVRGVVRDGIIWTAKHDIVGIDHRDVDHYREVKDSLTAEDYDGVSVHYFVDGKSYRGVATAVPNGWSDTRVRVGEHVFDAAQISGVLIMNSLHAEDAPSSPVELHPEMLVEPYDLVTLVESARDIRDTNSKLLRDRGTKFTALRVYYYSDEKRLRAYTDGYREVELFSVEGQHMQRLKYDKRLKVNYEQYKHGKHVLYTSGKVYWRTPIQEFFKDKSTVVLVNYSGR